MATVLIAASEHLTVLKSRPELGDSVSFADADVLQALEAIISLRPDVVALEKQFADTSRGAALINRIKADPSLAQCDIRIVLHEGGTELVHREEEPPPGAAPEPPVLSPLDYRGTRRADRFNITSGVDVLIEGNPARLVNMSTVGVQVISPTILKPNQRIRLALTAQLGAARYRAAVAWASFELPQGAAPRYRAGIELLEGSDDAALTKFIKKHKA